MKIKIALFGLFFANSIIHPIYADQYPCELEADEVDVAPMVDKDDLEAEKDEKEKDEAKPENLIKLGTTVTVGSAILYQDEVISTKRNFSTQLKFKADVPKAWCNQDATLNIATGLDGTTFKIQNAAVTIGKMVTMGYTSTIFGYEKADSAWLISSSAPVLQVKYAYACDWFRIGYAIESPIALQVGWFDKTKSPKKGNADDKDRTNKTDKVNLDNDKNAFKIKNSFPALGFNLGAVTDDFNIGLNGLGRYTDYTHSTDPDLPPKDLTSIHYVTYGVNLGIQYQVVPKKFTATGQVIYVHGLGDYVSGLVGIQNDKKREEMCAAYYINQGQDKLSAIDAWGFGGTLAYCATPTWTLSIRGSYLTTAEDPYKPPIAFRAQWNVMPKVTCQANKYFTLSGGYNLAKEFRIDHKQEEGPVHKCFGEVKFSL